MAFLNLETKEDSAQQIEAAAGLLSKFKYTAQEWNLIRDKINQVHSIATGGPNSGGFNEVIITDDNVTVNNALDKAVVLVASPLNNALQVRFELQTTSPVNISKGLSFSVIQHTVTAPSIFLADGVSLLFDSGAAPSFAAINTGLKFTYIGTNKWQVFKLTSKDEGLNTLLTEAIDYNYSNALSNQLNF